MSGLQSNQSGSGFVPNVSLPTGIEKRKRRAEYMRMWRLLNFEKDKCYHDNWRKGNPDLPAVYQKNWRDNHPERRIAQQSVYRRIKGGELERPSICQNCGESSVFIEAHQDDYSKPLGIRWMCRACHLKEHLPEWRMKP